MSDERAQEATVTGLHAQDRVTPGTVLAGRFRIEALLGIGGMGMVYRATDLTLGVTVAVKVLRPELAHRPEAFERFRQELLLARQVSSPHVVRIHDLAEHEGRWLISMDYVDGQSLDKRLDRDAALPVEQALDIARQLAQGLAAAHARGVIHRDLKPANVLLDGAGNAYISDFGVARSLATSGLTQSGAVVGTPDYLSPEQARAEPVDARSDLYALGLILYEMLTGRLPFPGGTPAETLGQRMVRAPAPISSQRADLPGWLVRLIGRLLQPQPARRLPDAAAVLCAIERREVPRDLRPGARTVFALLTVLALAAGAWWWYQRAPTVPATPPLARILVFADRGANAPDAATLEAVAEHLRQWLAELPGQVVVDGERGAQALAQLGAAGAADATALRRMAAADRSLRLHLQQDTAGYTLLAELEGDDGTRQKLRGRVGATPDAALRTLLPMLAPALPAPAASEPALPTAPTALSDFGAGSAALQRGEPAAAREQLQAAVAADPGYTAAWLSLAEALQALGESEAARDAVERGQRVAANAPPRLRRRLTALAAMLDGDPTVAAGEWRALAEVAPDDTLAALRQAEALGASGDFSAAIERLSATAARDQNDPRLWFQLGKFSILRGDAQRAVDDYLVRALVLYKRSRNGYGQAEAANALGVGYGRLGQTVDAEEQYRKAVELRRAVGNRRGVATSLRNLAGLASLRGRFEQAQGYLDEARALYAELGDREGQAATENELGRLAEERGDYPSALDAYRRALQVRQEVGDARGAAESLDDVGFAHYQLGAYDSAEAFWNQAAEAFAALDDLTGAVRTEQNLGLLAAARGRWDDSRRRQQHALASAQAQQMVEEAAVSHRNLAELNLMQGRLDAALDQVARAQALFAEREDQRGLADAALLRARIALAAESPQQAARDLEAIETILAQSSSEQRAIAALLRAEIALQGKHDVRARHALDEARVLAQASGVRLLQLQAAELAVRLSGRADESLERASGDLGHAGLRLTWLEQEMARALASADNAGALAAYRKTQPLLRAGDYRRAFRLHWLGAQALTASGDAIGAEEARANAHTTLERLRSALPAGLQPAFERAPEVAEILGHERLSCSLDCRSGVSRDHAPRPERLSRLTPLLQPAPGRCNGEKALVGIAS